MQGLKPGVTPGSTPGYKPGTTNDIEHDVTISVDASGTNSSTIDVNLEGDDKQIEIGRNNVIATVDPDGGTVEMNVELDGNDLWSSEQSYSSSGTYRKTPGQNPIQVSDDHSIKVDVSSAGGASATLDVKVLPYIK